MILGFLVDHVEEEPHVVHAYNKYHSMGFDVFSVSFDSDPNRWKGAIAQDGLIWENHVSELNKWANAAAREYGITSIPHTMLIDKDGPSSALTLEAQLLSKNY